MRVSNQAICLIVVGLALVGLFAAGSLAANTKTEKQCQFEDHMKDVVVICGREEPAKYNEILSFFETIGAWLQTRDDQLYTLMNRCFTEFDKSFRYNANQACSFYRNFCCGIYQSTLEQYGEEVKDQAESSNSRSNQNWPIIFFSIDLTSENP